MRKHLLVLCIGLMTALPLSAQAHGADGQTKDTVKKIWQSEFDNMTRVFAVPLGFPLKSFDHVCDSAPMTVYVDKKHHATFRRGLPVQNGDTCVMTRPQFTLSGWKFAGRCRPHFVVYPCGTSSMSLVQDGYQPEKESLLPVVIAAPPNCDYKGVHMDARTGKLISWGEVRAAEELEIDKCEQRRHDEQSAANAAYNQRMAVWVPCETDVRKIARAKFVSDEEAGFQVTAACGGKPDKPRESEKCVGYWSGFETASHNDPRWIYLRHMDAWQTCLYKEVRAAETLCRASKPNALQNVDRAIEFKCGAQPPRPAILESLPYRH